LPSNEKLKALLALTNFRDLSFITIFSPATEGTVSFEQPTVKTADKTKKRPYLLYFIFRDFINFRISFSVTIFCEILSETFVSLSLSGYSFLATKTLKHKGFTKEIPKILE
jgi:hypothetical protein